MFLNLSRWFGYPKFSAEYRSFLPEGICAIERISEVGSVLVSDFEHFSYDVSTFGTYRISTATGSLGINWVSGSTY